MKKDDVECGYKVESPYLYPIDDLEHIILELSGISNKEDDAISDEAIDFAYELCHILDIEEEKDEH